MARNMIPKVREWRIRTGLGRYNVLAPTRQLALLNLRHYTGDYQAVISCGPIRKQGQHGPHRGMVVTEATWGNPS